MRLLRSTRRWLARNQRKELFLLFAAWRIWLFVFTLLGLLLFPLRSPHFLGGGLKNYWANPLFWSWANFDGEHYLAIAQRGYRALEHSFFPAYPLLMRYLAPDSLPRLTLAGLVISNIALLLSLFLLWKLLRLDFKKEVVTLSVLAFIAFPTSFYFGALYTESLFLLLAVGAFYAARQGKWLVAGILGAIASATRIYGILLFPALLVEWWQQKSKIKNQKSKFSSLIPLSLIPLGILSYMWFLNNTTGDPLAFYNELSVFGQQRSGEFVLLYQVFWRYFKMILTVTKTDPIYLTVLVEAAVGVLGLVLLVWGYLKKIRPSYLVFAFLGYILPTFTGSFSSLPRYVLVLFPIFMLLGMFLARRGRFFQIVYFIVSATLLVALTMLFIRGYWVA